jgi:hypothetical protein
MLLQEQLQTVVTGKKRGQKKPHREGPRKRTDGRKRGSRQAVPLILPFYKEKNRRWSQDLYPRLRLTSARVH